MSAIPSVTSQSNNPYRLLQLAQSGASNSAQNAATGTELAALDVERNQEGTNPTASALSPSNGQFVDLYA